MVRRLGHGGRPPPRTEEENMIAENTKMWIDGATYQELLDRWRFAPGGSPLFQGETGDYYKKVMLEKKAALSADEQVAASKAIGWERT